MLGVDEPGEADECDSTRLGDAATGVPVFDPRGGGICDFGPRRDGIRDLRGGGIFAILASNRILDRLSALSNQAEAVFDQAIEAFPE